MTRAKPHRTLLHVLWSKRLGWHLKRDRMVVAAYATKTAAIENGRKLALAHQPSSLRIHNQRGRFQREWTYPRSSDPHPPQG